MNTERVSLCTILFFFRSYTSIPFLMFPKMYAIPFYLFTNTLRLVPATLRLPTGSRLVFMAFSYLIP